MNVYNTAVPMKCNHCSKTFENGETMHHFAAIGYLCGWCANKQYNDNHFARLLNKDYIDSGINNGKGEIHEKHSLP